MFPKPFNTNQFKDYWETEKYGIPPKCPIIHYDKSIPHDFILYTNIRFFYNEFLGELPSPNEILIDKTGQIFQLAYHKQKFRYPVNTNQKITPEALKAILIASEIKDIEQYLAIEDIETLMLALENNQKEHNK